MYRIILIFKPYAIPFADKWWLAIHFQWIIIYLANNWLIFLPLSAKLHMARDYKNLTHRENIISIGALLWNACEIYSVSIEVKKLCVKVHDLLWSHSTDKYRSGWSPSLFPRGGGGGGDGGGGGGGSGDQHSVGVHMEGLRNHSDWQGSLQLHLLQVVWVRIGVVVTIRLHKDIRTFTETRNIG